MITLPFEGISPQRILYVSPTGSNTGYGSQSDPLKTIQAAVDLATPGTTIMVEAGTYVETVRLNASGLPDAPISLISVDGPGAAKIVPVADTRNATLSAFGEENIVISGFDVSGGGVKENGIQFGMSGTDFTDMTANIVVKDNIVHDTVKDGIKISQGDNIYVVDNTVSHAGDQGIDFVAVNNSVIARNDVSHITGTVAIFAKAGSTNVLIAQNHVADVAADGIAVGGWSNPVWMRPGFTQWEAKNVTVIDNIVEDVGKRPLNVLGAQDCEIVHNFLKSNPTYYYIVSICPDNLTPPLNSSDIVLKNNVFDRGGDWLQVLPGQNAGLVLMDNRFDGVFQGEAGPHSGPINYDLPWLPSGSSEHLFGTAGNDTLDGGDGADTLTGGAGNDTYIVDNTKDIVEENVNGGIDAVISSTTFTLGANVENLKLLTGAGSINAKGNELANALTGNDANNILDGGLGIDKMIGGKGDDTYFVDNIKDTVVETLAASSGGGIDTVHSFVDFTLGTNLDHLILSGSATTGAGNTLENHITGTDTDNRLTGLDGNDTVSGGGGNDTLVGGIGLDSLAGGGGDDTYSIDNIGDRISEIGGIDTVRSSITFGLAEDGTGVQGTVENLTLIGGTSICATGNALANIIIGNTGANALVGNGGNDTIDGGAGNDNVIGGAGNDQIVVSSGNDVVRYTSALDGHDVIVSFDGNASNGQDVFDLNALFDSLNVATADRAPRVSFALGAGTVDVHVDVSALGDGSNIISVATLHTIDVITVGQDVLVGSA